MIQRIQTIHLLLSVVLGITALILSLTNATGSLTQTIFAEAEVPRYAYLALLGIGVLLTVWSIFLYKRRMFQYKIVRFGTIAYTLGIITLIASALHKAVVTHFELAPLLPVVCIILNILACRRIRFDENLVRSADRLR